MSNVLILLVHMIASVARLLGPGGARGLLAETLLLRHQLLIVNRTRKRAPNLRTWDRISLGVLSLFMRPRRIRKSAIVVSPATILNFHSALVKRKYRRLFSGQRKGRPGPQGPSTALIRAIVEMKRRNPRFGCPRIAQQLSRAFGLEIDKDVVRRVLAKHYRPEAGGTGPSWLTFIGHMKDSLWSIDLFRCESMVLKTHWVLVVMDQYSRRIVGFAVQVGDVDGPALCRMFAEAIAGGGVPKYVSTDNDPLFTFGQWKANLRLLEVSEVKTVPYVPLSHPFVERLVGTTRREYLDHVLFWTASDLEHKLNGFKRYYNGQRTHASLSGAVPVEAGVARLSSVATPGQLESYRWKKHCGGLVQLPVAA